MPFRCAASQGAGYLGAIVQRALKRNWPGEGFPFDVFHYEKRQPFVDADVVKGADMRMVQCCDRARFAFESIGVPDFSNLMATSRFSRV